MNLSQVKIKLKAENIQSFINDFLKIDGIIVSDIKLFDDMILINKIKYKSFGTISIGLKLERIQDGILSISIKKLKAISIPLSVMPVNFILKMVLSKINIPGIFSDGKSIQVDLKIVLNEFDIDFLSLDIKDIKINTECIDVILGNIDFNMQSLMNKTKKEQELKTEPVTKIQIISKDNCSNENINDYQANYFIENDINNNPNNNFNNNSNINDTEDSKFEDNDFTEENQTYFQQYSRVRNKLYNEKFKSLDKELLGKIIFLLPDIGVLCYRLLKDKRIKKGLKLLLIFTISYLLNPFDIVNNKIHILNKIDDTILLIFTLNKIFTSIDRRILDLHFEGSSDTLDFLIDSFDVLNQFLGADRINKLYSVVEKFVK